MKILVLCPHFDPDTAPTGVVMSRLVSEFVDMGHRVDVVTSMPWYRDHRVEAGWRGRWIRTERTAWGSITRVQPFPGKDKRQLLRRTAGFGAFSLLAGVAALRAGRWFGKVDVVFAMSPPLTLGLTGWLAGRFRRAPLVFNVQDVFPDAAIRTGAISNRKVIAIAKWLEKLTYRRARAITVLSDDLLANLVVKMNLQHQARVHVIPNFVDTDAIRPADRMTGYRSELGIGTEPVVLYAGNIGFSQSVGLMIDAAAVCPDVQFVINGDGAARAELEMLAAGLANVHFVDYQPVERLSEVLASGDIHVALLRAGLGDVSVPSKTYSSLAAGRPIVAAIDAETEIPRLLESSKAGISVPPDDVAAFVAAIRAYVDDPQAALEAANAGRAYVVELASPSAVAGLYGHIFTSVTSSAQRR
jgi:colanic acid biosynthesis glycosyl transferase WcaI